MRILVVHPRMSIMGGGERVAIHSMLAGMKMGHEVTLLSEDFDVQRFEDFFGCHGLFENIRILSYPCFKPLIRSWALLYQRLYYYQTQFRKTLSGKNQFDIVLGTQDVGYVPTTRAPVVQYCYFPEYFRHLQSTPSSPLWKLYYSPARIFYRNRVKRIDRFLAVSDYTRGFVQQIWRRDSTTLYPPCPIQLYKSSNSDREDLAITIGRIVPEKRMHLLIALARKLPKTRFIIIGSVGSENDAYFKYLKKNAPTNLSIVLSPLRKTGDLVARAKVYIHCADNEHFGITIVEAMAAGCVPVVHDSGGPREIVTQDVGYRWKNTDQASQLISKLMEDDALRARLSRYASARAEAFSPQVFESSLTHTLKEYGA